MKNCHYRVLGVSRDASLDEIKKAFRQRSFETHPDVANGCPERFKAIANAASVLTNPQTRRLYDHEVSQNPFRQEMYARQPQNNTFQHRQRKAGPPPHGLGRVLENVFRPRNVVLGPILLFVTVSTARSVLGYDDTLVVDDSDQRVQAWMNPRTGRYETPAPWDPYYRQLNPTLEQVPRKQVSSRHQ